MTENHKPMRTISLPAELLTKMEELKQDREEDREKSVEEIVEEFCRDYVHVREMARDELARVDEINRSYAEHLNDCDDAEEWEELYRQMTEGSK